MGAVHGVSLKYVAFAGVSAFAARWVMPMDIDQLLFADGDLQGLDNLQLLIGLYLYNVSVINLVIAVLFNLKLGMGLLGKDAASGAIPIWSYVLPLPHPGVHQAATGAGPKNRCCSSR